MNLFYSIFYRETETYELITHPLNSQQQQQQPSTLASLNDLQMNPNTETYEPTTHALNSQWQQQQQQSTSASLNDPPNESKHLVNEIIFWSKTAVYITK